MYRWTSKDSRQYEKGRPLRGFGRYLRHKGPGKRLVHDRKTRIFALPRISSRPEEECYGHWECDLLHGNRKSGYIITAVERKSGFLMATYSADRSSTVVAAGIKQLFSRVPAWFFKSITYVPMTRAGNFSMTSRQTTILVRQALSATPAAPENGGSMSGQTACSGNFPPHSKLQGP